MLFAYRMTMTFCIKTNHIYKKKSAESLADVIEWTPMITQENRKNAAKFTHDFVCKWRSQLLIDVDTISTAPFTTDDLWANIANGAMTVFLLYFHWFDVERSSGMQCNNFNILLVGFMSFNYLFI